MNNQQALKEIGRYQDQLIASLEKIKRLEADRAELIGALKSLKKIMEMILLDADAITGAFHLTPSEKELFLQASALIEKHG